MSIRCLGLSGFESCSGIQMNRILQSNKYNLKNLESTKLCVHILSAFKLNSKTCLLVGLLNQFNLSPV